MNKAMVKWPSGSYGLPRPVNGCPNMWKEGMRYHDTENYHSNNVHSTSIHLSGPINEHGVRQEFCIKDDTMTQTDFDVLWPEGQYCIYKYGNQCPFGLKEGWVFWDDENQNDLDGGNVVRGYTPEGVYELDTLIYFCCSTKGDKLVPIELPLTDSFYLINYNSSECQSVKGLTGISEFIQWDDEDRGNSDAHSEIAPFGLDFDKWNTRIYYCFYSTDACTKNGFSCKESNEEDSAPLKMSAVVDDDNKRHETKKSVIPHIMGTTKRSSAVAVIIGCSVAGLIVGTAALALILKHFLNNRGYEAPSGDVKEFDDEEEVFPLPDHIW